MIVDSSAVICLIQREEHFERIATALADAERLSISAGNWVELQAVSTRRYGGAMDESLARVRMAFGIEIVPLTADQAEFARAAYRGFGMGSGHPARLNLGDCFAYALARATGEPLLFVGDDFGRTDIACAVY